MSNSISSKKSGKDKDLRRDSRIVTDLTFSYKGLEHEDFDKIDTFLEKVEKCSHDHAFKGRGKVEGVSQANSPLKKYQNNQASSAAV